MDSSPFCLLSDGEAHPRPLVIDATDFEID
jgi:hypothetical protein